MGDIFIWFIRSLPSARILVATSECEENQAETRFPQFSFFFPCRSELDAFLNQGLSRRPLQLSP